MPNSLLDVFIDMAERLDKQEKLWLTRCENCNKIVTINLRDYFEPATDTVVCAPCFEYDNGEWPPDESIE